MSDVRDYLEWRGDLSLAERPFNDVDNLIMTCVAYLDLSNIVPRQADGGSVSLAEACEDFLVRAAGDDVSRWVRSVASIDGRFVRALGESARFGASSLRGYVDLFDEEKTLQFSAVTCDLCDNHSFVAFRGTDNSLVGWKEDFMLSFRVTSAQHAAALYLEAQAIRARDEGRKLYVGGHSKGGLLAAYAAAALPEALREVVDRVWSDDGPGMASDACPVSARSIYGDRFIHVVPAYDIVGSLFDDGTPKLVVRSDADGAMQHDPMSWQVDYQGLIAAEGLDADSVRLSEALAGWLDGVNPDERERFTDELFDVLQASGATRLDEVMATPQSVQQVLGALGAADQRTKDLVWALLGAAVGANFESAKDAAVSMAAQAVAGITGAIADLALGDGGQQG
ncbi:Mbeg1-like protein [Paratractidigestivibacter sp.]|uniref:Mbeg1-like protein n=1 Tax=Paratractidigestivibacter sp. TaxID=2847316 RepID=UPI002AC8E6CD|nr:Mbeg1-like protein [Paratractidigestivibacter sp.]